MQCKIHYKLVTENQMIKETIKGDKNNELIKFILNNDNYIIKVEKDNIILEKENINSKLIFTFILNKKTNNNYYIKQLNHYLQTSIKTNKLLIDENGFYIEYKMWLEDEYRGKYIFTLTFQEEKND